MRRIFTGYGAILGAGVTAILAAAAPATAAYKPLGENWIGTGAIESVRPNGLTEIGLERTPDGVLHVAYPVFGQTPDGAQPLETVDHEIMVGTNPDKMATRPPNYEVDRIAQAFPAQNQAINPSVDLVSTPDGLRVFFAGLFPGNPLDSVLSTATAPPAGTPWTLPVPASATAPAQRSPVYAASGIGAGVQVDGTPVSTWGDSQPDGGGYRVGVGTNGADQRFSGVCCEIDPNVGVDGISGETMIAANLVDSAIQVRSTAGNAVVTVPESASVWRQQRISISGRYGADGVYVAYGTGPNMFEAVPAIWRIGADTFKLFPKQTNAEHVGLAPAPEGRIWLYWNRGLKLYAARSNPGVTKFGSFVSFPAYKRTTAIHRLNGEGSLGTLDLFAFQRQDFAGDEDPNQWMAERVPPGLTLKADSANVKRGKSLGFVVTDAGDPVEGAKVTAKLGGDKVADTTKANGKAKLSIPGDAPKGKHLATAEKDGYAREGYAGREATFKVTAG